MKRFNQDPLLSQRIEDERRAGAGESQQMSFAADIMPDSVPDTPADLQRQQLAAAAAQVARQLHLAGAGQASTRAPQFALSAAGGLATQPAHSLAESVGSEGGSGRGSSSSRSSWPQEGRSSQTEYSSASPSMVGPAQVLLPNPCGANHFACGMQCILAYLPPETIQ